MRITKRNGSEEDFDLAKIIIAITKANDATEGNRLSKEQIQDVADFIQYKCQKLGRAVSVEEVQDMVETADHGAPELLKWRKTTSPTAMTRSLVRQSNTTDNRILSLDRVQQRRGQTGKFQQKSERSIRRQRDYMAGEVSKDHHDASAAAAGNCGGAQRGHHPFP